MFYQILLPPNVMHIPLCDQNGLIRIAKLIPFLGVLNGLVSNLKIMMEIIQFESAELMFEAFADGFLAIVVAAKVGSSIAFAEGPSQMT